MSFCVIKHNEPGYFGKVFRKCSLTVKAVGGHFLLHRRSRFFSYYWINKKSVFSDNLVLGPDFRQKGENINADKRYLSPRAGE